MTTLDTGDGHRPAPKSRAGRRLLFSLVAIASVGAGLAVVMNTASRPARPPTPVAPATDTALLRDGVVAYYFHTTRRCPSCRKIEAYSQTALESAFEAELAHGSLQWRPVNIEEKGNEHFADDYKLYTKSLILSQRRAGREVRWKNLTRVWELVGNEPAFVDYVQRETRAYLEESP